MYFIGGFFIMTIYGQKMNKLCLTCALWGGQRKLDFPRKTVEADSASTSGECLGGGFNRQKRNANANCDKWKKWESLT